MRISRILFGGSSVYRHSYVQTCVCSICTSQPTSFLFQDKLISDFIPRVIPTVQQSLNTTKQRLAILPGGLGTIETARQLSEIQEALRLKVTP